MRISLSIMLLLTLVGCNLGPRHCIPQMDPPLEWNGISDETIPDSEPLELCQLFDDPLLMMYLTNLAYKNHDIALARAKVCEAYALRQISSAKLYPFIDQRIQYYRSLPAGGILTGEQAAPAGGGGILDGIPLNLKQQTFLANFDAIWEIDFFGKTRKEVDSSTAYIQMQCASYDSVLVSLLAEFTRVYLELRRTQAVLSLAMEEAGILQEKSSAVGDRLFSGLDSEIQLIEIEASLDGLLAEIPSLEAEVRHLMYRLAALYGEMPEGLLEELTQPSSFPETAKLIPVGAPSELLRRRPDIRFAEWQLAQATADVGVAISDFFPKFTISGSYGYQNLHLGMTKGSGESWSYGGNIFTPIFHGGQLSANLRRYRWIRKEAVISYEQSVIQCLEEAESAMVRLVKSREVFGIKEQIFLKRNQLLSHAEDLYNKGLAGSLQLFDSRLQKVRAQRDLVNSQADSGIQLVALYKALGGTWK